MGLVIGGRITYTSAAHNFVSDRRFGSIRPWSQRGVGLEVIQPSAQPSGLGSRLDGAQFVFALLTLPLGYFSIAASQISLGIALLLLLARWIVERTAPPATGLEKTALLLAAWALLMVPLSTDVPQSAVYYRRFYLFTALWVGAAAAVDERRRGLLLGFLLGGAAAAGLYGIVDQLHRYGDLMSHRLTAVFNAMTGGAVLMMAALVAAGCLIAPGVGRRMRLAAAAAAVPIALGVAMTMTRSAQLGLVVGVGAMLFLRKPKISGLFAALVLAAGIVLAVWGEDLLPPRYWKRISPEFVIGGKSTVARLDMWKGGWKMIQARPIRGVGDRGLKEIAPEYYTTENGLYWGHMHSNIVHLAVIWGVPGLVLAQAFLIMTLVLLIRSWRRLVGRVRQPDYQPVRTGWVLGAIGVWVGFYVAGLSEWYFGDAESMLIYFLIIGCALGRDAAAKRPEATEPLAN